MKNTLKHNLEINNIDGKAVPVINFGEGYGAVLTDMGVLKSSDKEQFIIKFSSYSGEEIKTGDYVEREKLDQEKINQIDLGLVFNGMQGVTSLRTLAVNLEKAADAWESRLNNLEVAVNA